MQYGKLSDANPLVKALLLVGLMLVCSILMMLLLVPMTGSDLQSVPSMRMQQVMQALGMFVLPTLLGSMLWSPKPRAWLHVDRRPQWGVAGWLLVLIIVAQPCINMLAWFNEQLHLPAGLADWEAWMVRQETLADDLLRQMMQYDLSACGWCVNLLVLAALPAVGEELFFRGALQGLFAERGRPAAAIWVTAVLFSAMHLQFMGFIPRLLLGALFGYVLLWTGSLWVPMMMHFVNNAFVVSVTMLSFSADGQPSWWETIGQGGTWWFGAVSAVAAGLILWHVRRQLRPKSR
ncbi:MAG: CPBP family intramembrane metalloprotease [Paludibacteraceae bacterium]|nr:CPBP family intramembrane metalloprotease [Paludibacteraceae bacterium]